MFIKNNFKVEKYVNEGSYGKIYKILFNKKNYCLKVIKKKIIEKNKCYSNYSIDDIKQNIKLLQKFNHINLMKSYISWEDSKKFYIINELLLYNYIVYDTSTFEVSLFVKDNPK